jgi:hypothetical protein
MLLFVAATFSSVGVVAGRIWTSGVGVVAATYSSVGVVLVVAVAVV